MKRRTILYVGGFELPDKNAAAQRVLAIGKLLRSLGFNVVFLGVDRDLPGETPVEATKSETVGFDTWAVPYPQTISQWLAHVVSADAVRTLVETLYRDEMLAVICYNHPAAAQHRINRICRRAGIAHIADATEWYDSTNDSPLFRVAKWLDTTLRMRVVHNEADGVIATSRYLSDFYRKKHNTVVDLPTLCDSDALARIPSAAREKDPGIRYLLYAGSPFHVTRLDQERNNLKDRLDYVISLLGRMHARNCRFVLEVCGITKDNYLLAFPEHSELLQAMSDSVIFLGRRSHEEIIRRTKSSDFTIFLRRESRVTLSGFPTKFSESICCGTPVITNMLTNIEGYLVDGMNGFQLDINDPEAQDRKMLEILNLDRRSVDRMRLKCLTSRALDYRSFAEPVRRFVAEVTANN